MAAKLFEYAVMYHPKTKKDAQGNELQGGSVLLVAPTHVLAGNDKEVAMRAARAIPDEYMDKLEQVEIVVRPF